MLQKMGRTALARSTKRRPVLAPKEKGLAAKKAVTFGELCTNEFLRLVPWF
jgi:hypothetical protein